MFVLMLFLAANTPEPNAACAQCHPKIAQTHRATGMANALHSGELEGVLQAHPRLTFSQGQYKYNIERKGKESWYSVTDGKSELSVAIAWAFGKGSAGQTYLLKRGDTWYEGRVSFYRDIRGLDLTVGARPDLPRNIEEAFGRELSPRGALECFNCHATNAVVQGALKSEGLTSGVQCARCHQNADSHASSMAGRAAAKTFPPKLSKSTAEDMSEFCGQCHRTWAQIAADGPHNLSNVRFQPYRLTNSKCYDTADARIGCTACHDPHASDPHEDSAFYDSRCNACHAAAGASAKSGAPLCKTRKSGCASCHMPKIEIKETHTKFTDHWIRIVRPGEPHPH